MVPKVSSAITPDAIDFPYIREYTMRPHMIEAGAATAHDKPRLFATSLPPYSTQIEGIPTKACGWLGLVR